MPENLINATDVIAVDDPDWAVMATAAELAFNDITYEDKSAEINTKANALYKEMAQNNRANGFDNPRKVQTNVQRITGTSNYGSQGWYR